MGGLTHAMSARSYKRIMGANERLHLAIAGLGRRLDAYYAPVALKSSNVELLYLCDVMQKQRESALQKFGQHIDYRPKLENDIRKVLSDKDVDVLINATPDHWHAPGTWLAVQAGKHVYVEKPCGHNPREGEILALLPGRYGKVIQMGNQQRSAVESIELISQIHSGAIGEPYKAVAFYAASRGEVPLAKPAPVPDGLDWELFQGPAPRQAYRHDTWDYNWHWYGWTYGTAEAGNNGTHELDVARWALQVEHPLRVSVEAAKRHFATDGWTMYDTMEATFRFAGERVIKWECQCRNGYQTYGSGRGVIIYGTNGSAYVDRDGYRLYSREGLLTRERKARSVEAGTALGGGGDMTTRHVVNFFEAVRGKEKQNSPIAEGVKSVLLCHLANIAYRTGSDLVIDPATGRIKDRKAMKLWSRQYEKGWEPPIR